MLISELISELKQTRNELGDLPVATPDWMSWRSHKGLRLEAIKGSKVIDVKHSGIMYIPLSTLQHPRGFLDKYRDEVLELPTEEVILLSLN